MASKKRVSPKRLVKKAVKKIEKRTSSRHSDEILKKNQPAPKKETKKPGRPKKEEKKLPPFKYRGKVQSQELSDRIRAIRAKYVKEGKFLTNRQILRQYFKIEDQLKKGKKVNDENDPLHIKNKVEQGLDIQPYELNGVVSRLMDIHQQVGNITIQVIGFGQTEIEKFKNFGDGLRRVDEELGIIWEAFDVYAAINGLNSPLFSVILVWDENAKIAFIDFNKTIFKSVDVTQIISIIMDIKNISQNTDIYQPIEEEKEPEEVAGKEEPKKPEPKEKKKPKSKAKAKKKKAVSLKRSNGQLDMRFKVNQQIVARREENRKKREKKKRQQLKEQRAQLEKYFTAAFERKLKRKKKK